MASTSEGAGVGKKQFIGSKSFSPVVWIFWESLPLDMCSHFSRGEKTDGGTAGALFVGCDF